MEERRLLLAVALSLLVLTAYQLLFAPSPPAAGGRPPAPAARPRRLGARAAPGLGPGAAPAAPAARPPPPCPRSRTPGSGASRSRPRTPPWPSRTAARASSRGGSTRYRDARGRPEEMVQTAPGGPRPLDIETGDPALDERLREALFLPSAEHAGPARARRRRRSRSATRRATSRRRRPCASSARGTWWSVARVRPARGPGAARQGHLGPRRRQPHGRGDARCRATRRPRRWPSRAEGVERHAAEEHPGPR